MPDRPDSPDLRGIRPALLRPLPRVRTERFVWQTPDWIWLVIVAISCALFTPRHDISHLRLAIGLFLSVLSAASAYVAGYKMHSRVAGIASAVLVATSQNYAALCVQHPVSGAVACAAIIAVASYSVGWMIVTYIAACIAFTLGFNGALIGLVIAAVPALQKREHALAGLIGYLSFAVLWSFATHSVHLPHGLRPWATWRDAAPLGGLAAFVGWFFVPFYAEATLKGAWDRWLLGLALVGCLVLILFTSTSAIAPQLYDAYPIAMLVVGVALARLIPLISGDYPAPWKSVYFSRCRGRRDDTAQVRAWSRRRRVSHPQSTDLSRSSYKGTGIA